MPERREKEETLFRSRWRRKTSRGKAQECGKLKEASKGGETSLIERVAKPEGGSSWKAGQRFRDVSKEMKRRVSSSENAEGQESLSEEFATLALGRPRTGEVNGAYR